MGLLSSEDKVKINRAIPKGSNSILDATVAKLFVAYPDPDKYVDTGVSGAVVLVDDVVGKTFFIKIVDICGSRGVIWDQELCINFEYHKDRTFFHSFEMDHYTAGLLFEDTSEANHFFKRVSNKEKYGSKHTVQHINSVTQKNKDRLNQQQTQTAGPRGFSIDVHDPSNAQKIRRAKNIMYYNDVPPPEWKSLYEKLQREEGINEWDISENKEYIKEYVQNNNYTSLVGLEPPIPRKYQYSKPQVAESVVSPTISTTKKKAPPPPPATASPEPSSAAATVNISEPAAPQHKYNVPPAPSFLGAHHQQASSSPATSAYQQAQNQQQTTTTGVHHTLPPLPSKIPSPAPHQVSGAPQNLILSQFSRGAVNHNNTNGPAIPSRNFSGSSNSTRVPPPANGGRLVPPPPPASRSAAGAPPPLPASRNSAGLPAPPPPPARSSGGPPPPPPARRGGAPPPLPPTRRLPTPPQQSAFPPQQQQYQQQYQQQPQYNNSPSLSARYTQPLALPQQQPPVPPVPPAPAAPPVPPMFSSPPAPPQFSAPPPAMFGAPAPPDFGHRSNESSAPASTMPPAGGDARDALLASIRSSGVGQLKKVDKNQIKHF